MIDTVNYSNESGNVLRVALDDGTVWFTPWPCNTWHGRDIQAWIDLGNEIAAYVPPEPEEEPQP